MKIKKNGKVINLTESDLKRIVKHTLNEESVSGIKVWVGKGEYKGKVIIHKGGKNHKYLLEAYSFGWWWDIVVSSVSIIKNFIKYLHPKTEELLTSPLDSKSINKIKKHIGDDEISLGTTDDGTKLRLTKL